MKINRRTVLRQMAGGVGVVTVGLPVLDCFLNNSGTAYASGEALPVCFGHYYQSLGLTPGKWIPETTGAYKNNSQMKVLDSVKDKVNIFSGMRYFLDGRPHETHVSTLQIATTGAIFDAGKIGPSLDSKVADVIGTRSRFRSLDVTFDGSRTGTSRRSGSSVSAYEGSPLALYNRIFGPEFKDPNAAEFVPDPSVVARRSALSYVTEQRTAVMNSVGASDKARLDEYFTSVRELERQLDLQLQKPAPMQACTIPTTPEQATPNSILENIQTNSKLMGQLLAHAMACGQTRVFNVNVGCNGWRRAGSTQTWHTSTHEESIDPTLDVQKTVFGFMNEAVLVWAEFLRTLDGVREGNGTLLDRSLVLWQTDHGDARTHTIENIPIMTAGKAGGLIKTGLHIQAPGEPCTRVALTAMETLGVPINNWGDRSNLTSRTVSEIVNGKLPSGA